MLSCVNVTLKIFFLVNKTKQIDDGHSWTRSDCTCINICLCNQCRKDTSL